MLIVRRLLAAATIFVLFSASSAGADARAFAPGPLGDLQLGLATMAMHAPGHVGVMVEDLTTGLSTAINAGAQMPAASTIKIPVMVEVFRQLSHGNFDLNRRVHLTQGDRDWGWGDLADAPGGSSYSVAKLLALMITESDNTATNMLIRLVGRPNINHTMHRLGLSQTKVGDYIRSEGPIRWALRSSPRDMVRLLGAMAHDQLVDEWSSREMIAILTGQHHNTLLPEPLPAGTTVAHKTGTLHDTLNDVGIVYLEDEPYVIAVMTTDLPSLDAGRSFIRGVSKMAWNELTRFADWRSENGMPGFTPPAARHDATPAPDFQMWMPSATSSAAASLDEAAPQPTPTP